MAIISFEDLENIDIDKDDSEPDNNLDLITDSIERDFNTLDSLFNLDLLIMNLDKTKEELELNKITIKELQEILYNTSISTSHIMKVLTGSPIPKITKYISKTITVEDINHHPLISLEEQKTILEKMKDSVINKAKDIIKLRKTLIEKIQVFFLTIEKSYLVYKEKSKLLIDFYNKNRNHFTLKENCVVSSENAIVLSEFLDVVINNYSNYINGYERILSMTLEEIYNHNGNLDMFDLISFKDTDSVKSNLKDGNLDNYYPLALNLGIKKDKITTETISINKETLQSLLFGIREEKDFKKLEHGYSPVFVRPKEILKIKELSEIGNLLESSYNDMVNHYGIYSSAAEGHNPYSIIIFDIISYLSVQVFNQAVNMLPSIAYRSFFSNLSKGLISLYRNQDIYLDIFIAQRELMSFLNVRDDIQDLKFKKELEEKLKKAIDGKLN